MSATDLVPPPTSTAGPTPPPIPPGDGARRARRTLSLVLGVMAAWSVIAVLGLSVLLMQAGGGGDAATSLTIDEFAETTAPTD